MTPGSEVYGALDVAVEALNVGLFDRAAGPVLVSLRAPGPAAGMLVSDGWLHAGDGRTIAELRVNPQMLARPPVDQLAVVAHELAHLVVGNREGHGPSWQAVMSGIGLEPIEPHPGSWDQEVTPGGRFDVAANELVAAGWSIPWRVRELADDLATVVCVVCGQEAWAVQGAVLACVGRLGAAGHPVHPMLPLGEVRAIEAVTAPPADDCSVVCARCGEETLIPYDSAPDELGWFDSAAGWVCCA